MSSIIDPTYIHALLEEAKQTPGSEIGRILEKAGRFEGLTHREVAALIMCAPERLESIFAVAGRIKQHIYGNRVVMFAPLYVSDYCVNGCTYCGYRHSNEFPRRRLTMREVENEVRVLESMGHKRLAVEAGEDDANCSIDYILDVIRTIYATKLDHGEIRRANVNIASTTVENYRKLKDVGIGTYILFQETYHRDTYERVHPAGPKHNYDYHLTAFDRAQQAGIDDVGGGVLFGLYDWRFEVVALMLHNEYLERNYGVGFHTISMPRLCKAPGMDLTAYPYIPSDDDFEKIVALIRIAVPFTGMIISTRETAAMRAELIHLGISQVSGGSNVEVGGYQKGETAAQFELHDGRSALDVVKWLLDAGMIPSFCTACYRTGRTGDRFMALAKSGRIKDVCLPNALLTLCEYASDYGDDELTEKAAAAIDREIAAIPDAATRERVTQNLRSIRQGKERDLYL